MYTSGFLFLNIFFWTGSKGQGWSSKAHLLIICAKQPLSNMPSTLLWNALLQALLINHLQHLEISFFFLIAAQQVYTVLRLPCYTSSALLKQAKCLDILSLPESIKQVAFTMLSYSLSLGAGWSALAVHFYFAPNNRVMYFLPCRFLLSAPLCQSGPLICHALIIPTTLQLCEQNGVPFEVSDHIFRVQSLLLFGEWVQSKYWWGKLTFYALHFVHLRIALIMCDCHAIVQHIWEPLMCTDCLVLYKLWERWSFQDYE